MKVVAEKRLDVGTGGETIMKRGGYRAVSLAILWIFAAAAMQVAWAGEKEGPPNRGEEVLEQGDASELSAYLEALIEERVARIQERSLERGGCPAPPTEQSGYQAAVADYDSYAEMLAILDSAGWLVSTDAIEGTGCYLFGYCNSLDPNGACFELKAIERAS